MGFGIIIIGDEILSGKRTDKHLAKIIELLSERGLSLAWAEYLGDDPARITETLRRTMKSADIVFSCGGEAQPRTITLGSVQRLRLACHLCCILGPR